MIDKGRKNILGVNINAVDYSAAVNRIAHAAANNEPLAVSALAVHGVMTGALDSVHRQRLNGLDLVVPDGQPVRWALNWLHKAKLKKRVYGPELMLRVCQRAADDQLPIFLFGGSGDMLELLSRRLVEMFPGLIIAGKRASLFRRLNEHERNELCDEIRQSGASITFAGIGCPRQEVWAYENRDRLNMPILAVGAAFAFHAGQLSQAPPALQRMGLEWGYRLFREPLRLWKRYLLLNPLYLTMLATQYFGLRRFESVKSDEQPPELMYG